MSKPIAISPESVIAQCLPHLRGKYLTEYLKGYAPLIVITARIMGPVSAGKSLGPILIGKSVSPTPILNIVAMVESKEIPMTREQLKAEIDKDEGAKLFYALNPWIIDPTGKSAPPAKKGRKPKNITKLETDDSPKESPIVPKKKAPRAKEPSNATPPPTAKSDSSEHDQVQRNSNKPPRLTAEQLDELTRQEIENQRRPLQEKKAEPNPPVFRCSPPPPKGAPESDLEAWKSMREQAIADYIKDARKVGWEIPPDWNGYNVSKVAKRIGT